MAFRYFPATLQMMELKAKGCPGAGDGHPGAVSTLNGGAGVALPTSEGLSGKPRSQLGAGH